MTQISEKFFNVRSLRPFEVCLIGGIFALSLSQTLVTGNFDTIGTLSALCGVICVVLGAKGSMANWAFGIVECFLYAYICLKGHIYGDAIQRIFYTLPMQFVGWYMWSHRRRSDDHSIVQTRIMSWAQRVFWLIVIAACTWLMAWVLGSYGHYIHEVLSSHVFEGSYVKVDYTRPLQLYMDAFTTVVMMVAMYISTRAYADQWILWIAINVLSVCIWMQNLGADEHAFMTMSKYALYFINSIYGLVNWWRLSKK